MYKQKGIFLKKKKSYYILHIYSYNLVSIFQSNGRWKGFDLEGKKILWAFIDMWFVQLFYLDLTPYALLSSHWIDWHAISIELGLQLSLNKWNFKGGSIGIFCSSLELINV